VSGVDDRYDRVDAAAAAVRDRCGAAPLTAVVLGSGLGEFAGTLTNSVTIPYGEMPGWPESTVVGHAGTLVVGETGGRRIAALAGRAHAYEGHPVAAVVFGVRAMARLGVREVILTNAAGGINTRFGAGALMVIDDHINLTGANPLAGPNDERFGARFPDMSEVYSRRLRGIADAVAAERGFALEHGIYAGLLGPSYETPAEIRYLRAIGADAVGMSTVLEAIAARHMGVEVLGVSCITNMAAGVFDQPLLHSEVLETAERVKGAFMGLLEGVVGRL
jgi:purine-nucleoside phosphorylase